VEEGSDERGLISFREGSIKELGEGGGEKFLFGKMNDEKEKAYEESKKETSKGQHSSDGRQLGEA